MDTAPTAAAGGRPQMAVTTGEHAIQNRYCFWYLRRNKSRPSESYEESIKPLGSFDSVEGFWSVYNHIVRPNDITQHTEYHLFKENIKPIWEHDANARGGKWMVRLRKGLASVFWEELLLAIIGEQFDVGNEICGAVLSLRFTEDIISVWNRNADNNDALAKIRDHMQRLFKLPSFVAMDYRRHDSARRPRTESEGKADKAADASAGGSRSNSNSGGGGGDSRWRARGGGYDNQYHGHDSSNSAGGGGSSSGGVPPVSRTPWARSRSRDDAGADSRGSSRRDGSGGFRSSRGATDRSDRSSGDGNSSGGGGGGGYRGGWSSSNSRSNGPSGGGDGSSAGGASSRSRGSAGASGGGWRRDWRDSSADSGDSGAAAAGGAAASGAAGNNAGGAYSGYVPPQARSSSSSSSNRRRTSSRDSDGADAGASNSSAGGSAAAQAAPAPRNRGWETR